MSPSNNNFQWRPNDNSATTNLRYDLEAAHWVKSFKSASANTSVSLAEAFGIIGLILAFALTLVFLILQIIVEIITWVRKMFHREPKPSQLPPEPSYMKQLTDEEIDELLAEMED
jgi:hypothetical protein